MTKRITKKTVVSWIKTHKRVVFLTIAATLLFGEVFWFYGEGLKNMFFYFYKTNTPVSGIILFYGNNCAQCIKVDDFIKNNKVETKIAFTRLEVFHNVANANIMEDKSQICGLDPEQIGVPFVWDGKHCFIGYIDVINFFERKIYPVK